VFTIFRFVSVQAFYHGEFYRLASFTWCVRPAGPCIFQTERARSTTTNATTNYSIRAPKRAVSTRQSIRTRFTRFFFRVSPKPKRNSERRTTRRMYPEQRALCYNNCSRRVPMGRPCERKWRTETPTKMVLRWRRTGHKAGRYARHCVRSDVEFRGKNTYVVPRPHRFAATVRPAVRPVTGVRRTVRPTARAVAVRPTVRPFAVVIQRAVRLAGASRLTRSVPPTVRPLSGVPSAAVLRGHVQSPAVPDAVAHFTVVPTAVRPFDRSPAVG